MRGANYNIMIFKKLINMKNYSIAETADILERHNKWRRGDEDLEMLAPEIIGVAIDAAVKHLRASLASSPHKNQQ